MGKRTVRDMDEETFMEITAELAALMEALLERLRQQEDEIPADLDAGELVVCHDCDIELDPHKLPVVRLPDGYAVCLPCANQRKMRVMRHKGD